MAGSYRNYFGTKFYSVNPRYGMYAYFMLYDAKTAEPLALMEANYLGQIRTGAASGYATDLLANPKADTLAVIGSGFQGRTQVEAVRAVRPIKTVRVWSRDEEKRKKFAEDCRAQAAATAEEAVRGAGTMINAMGSNVASRRELPGELVRRAALVAVDSLEQAKIEAGDLILPDSWANVRELQTVQRHFDPTQITIFKSLGICVEDVAAAAFAYERALLTPGRALATPERFVDRNRATR
jgi:ornithine cyclodeaminase/alanine dehydrogenase-like protein (mu-crystallin family)